MTESAANRPFFLIGIIILLLLLAGIGQAQLTSIGNQEALSSFGSATNSINISESEGSSMREVSPPAPPAQGDVGWIVGSHANGYGVILHTTDGGENWTRQGSPNTIPNVELTDVRAIDACNAWAVGRNNGHYGVILRTMDGGKT